MDTPAGQHSSGGSSGGHARAAEEPSPKVADQEPTVISGRAPQTLPLGGSVAEGGRHQPGMRMAQFELLEYVGGGGMGRVFRAMDTALARTVAVKVLSPEQVADQETLARFRNEAQSAARLNHENIVQVYHVGEAEGLPYIVFEFIEGMNLRTTVEQRGPLPLVEAINCTYQVVRALEHAASRNVVHRDIKPSNVLLTPDGRVKLIDLGLARLQRLGEAEADLTASGVTLGTFDYISPEQARDPRDADARSDVYSLGCTFFVLAGRPPFPEGTVLQKLLQHQAEEPPDIREFRPELPERVSAVLRKMMAKDPRHRYQTPAELIGELVSLAEDLGLHQAVGANRSWTQEERTRLSALQRHLPWIAPAAVLIGVVFLLDFMVWSPEPAPRSQPIAVDGGASSGTVGDSPVLKGSPGTGGGAAGSSTAAQEVVGEGVASDRGKTGAKVAVRGSAAESQAAVAASDAAGSGSLGPGRALLGDLRLPTTEAGLGPVDPSSAGALLASPASTGREGVTAKAIEVQREGNSGGVGTSKSAVRPGGAGVLVVDGLGREENTYATLERACAAAVEGDVVELRFNGPREERPIVLHNRRITIRAFDPFRPVVVFRPTDTDPGKFPRAMITLSGGQLTLVNVALELSIPRETQADRWSLVEIRQGKAVRLERCVLTLRNAAGQGESYHQDVAFFRIQAPRGSTFPRSKRPPSLRSAPHCRWSIAWFAAKRP